MFPRHKRKPTMHLTEQLQLMKQSVRNGEHKKFRQSKAPNILSECESKGLSWPRRMSLLTHRMCEAEHAVIIPDEKILFMRTVPVVPPIYSNRQWKEITKDRVLHEMGPISNICADWSMVLSQGLLKRKDVAIRTRQRLANEPEAIEFLDCAIETIDAVLALAAKYAQSAKETGLEKIAGILERVPAHPPHTFHEALQSLRLCHAVVWMSSHYHVGFGRFDQYMWPYLKADLDAGRLNVAEAEELLAEFFISINKDTDLYPGVQQGDNGQSLMLGGLKCDGTDGVNELTRMVLRVACALSMIDPKINLRINPNTDLELLTLASKLTKKGLGFPQYSNDDVVIPALVHHGYNIEDARDYTVAACWEFIIPGKGMDIVNVDAVSIPAAVDKGIREGLAAKNSFENILDRVQKNIEEKVKKIVREKSNIMLPPAPYYSVLMDGCLERGRDLSKGARYNNYGIHGACASDAADALAAVKKLVFDEKTVAPDQFLKALENNYEGYESLRQKAANEAPKVGNNDDYVDLLLVKLFDFFADACQVFRDNGRGGLIRPGSGSAMFYVWFAREVAAREKSNVTREKISIGATAEGRRQGQLFSSNLAPALNASIRGPVSVLQSFSKINYQKICNGGPLTMELSDAVFCDEDSTRKVAMFVRTFAQLGGHQLQLNTLNVETLEDAQRNPQAHKNLIVRVWGWSGYFCELAPEYQEHVIARHKYGI